MADIIQLDGSTPQEIIANLEATSTQSATPAHDITDSNSIGETILRQRIIEEIETIYDPEIPVNIYELGLIYDLLIDEENNVIVHMTLTSPACPVAGTLPGDVQAKIKNVPGVNNVMVELVWDPPYNMYMMSDAARLQLGLM